MAKGKSTRKALSNSVRFEVFKRDSFTCQYCGRKSPEVILNIDHIVPVASGGMNDIVNLLTSCQGCNSGKGKRHLATREVIDKSYDAVRDLAERAEQLKMMAEWQMQVYNAETSAVDVLILKWKSLTGHDPTPVEDRVFRKLIRKHSLTDVIEGLEHTVNRNMGDDSLGYVPRSKRETILKWLPASVGYVSKPQATKDAMWIRACLQNHFNVSIMESNIPYLELLFSKCSRYEMRDALFSYQTFEECVKAIQRICNAAS